MKLKRNIVGWMARYLLFRTDRIGDFIFSRIIRGIGIASPGRDHIHHKLMLNYSPEGSLGIILILTLCTGFFGMILENNFEPWVSTLMFFLYASFYYIYAYGFQNIKSKLMS